MYLNVQKMVALEFIQVFQVVIGQVQAGGACHSPNPFELTLIVALMGGIGVFSVASGIAIVSMANTIVALLISGASIGAVVAAVSGNAAATGGSLELITQMVLTIKGILGC
jgi:hypothetical protein